MAVTIRVAPGQAGLVTVAQGASLQVDVDLVQLGVVRVVVVAGLYTPVLLLYTSLYTCLGPVIAVRVRGGGGRQLEQLESGGLDTGHGQHQPDTSISALL